MQWFPDLGFGYYPVKGQPYDHAYWNNYRRLDLTPCGEVLTALRMDFVNRYLPLDQPVLDVGIGGGKFVDTRPNTYGYDVNPEAVAWLREEEKFFDPSDRMHVPAVCFWDSLEHIHNPRQVLECADRFVFVSLPIFVDCDDALYSKHYKPDEHCWYFTAPGLMNFMHGFGFKCIAQNQMEQSAGREQIDTFAFDRR